MKETYGQLRVEGRMDGGHSRSVMSVSVLQRRRRRRSLVSAALVALQLGRRRRSSRSRRRVRQRRVGRPHVRGRREEGGTQILCNNNNNISKLGRTNIFYLIRDNNVTFPSLAVECNKRLW